MTATHSSVQRGRDRFARRNDASGVVLERRAELDGLAPMDVAETFRDMPGLSLLESARPGRKARWSFLTADPVAVLEAPAAGRDPFAEARRLVARLDHGPLAEPHDERLHGTPPPFLGGLVGYLAYDLGHALERLPTIVADDQAPPPAFGWPSMTGSLPSIDATGAPGWPAGPLTVTAASSSAASRRSGHASSAAPNDVPMAVLDRHPSSFRSSLDRAAYESGVEAIRAAIARGDIYQANLTRRLSAPFEADPWPLYRALRTGDPALFAAYLDLDLVVRSGVEGPTGGVSVPRAPERRGRRAIVSASPEPFLSVDRSGLVATDPIKGTRPRGATPEEDRVLAAELLASAKDRAPRT